MADGRAARIARLNDVVRREGRCGQVVCTRGVLELGETFLAQAIEAVRAFSEFTPEHDPHNEHERGAVTAP